MDDAFILYQSEIDALIDKGYKDALEWLKAASLEFPNASVEDLLKTAQSIVATTKLVSIVEKDEDDFEEFEDELVEIPEEATVVVIEKVIDKPVAVEIVGANEAPTNENLEVIEVVNPEGNYKRVAPAGYGFEVLEGKFADEYVDDSLKVGVKHEHNEEPVHGEPDYKRNEATGFTLGGDVEISVGSKEYIPPSELVVDLSVSAPNLAPAPNEVVEEGFGGEASIEIKSKEYTPPEELISDISIPEGITEEVLEIVGEKKGLFSRLGKKKAPERPIAYLPPKDLDFEFDGSKNPSLELEESPTYKPKNIIINEASTLEREPVEFLTPQLTDEDEHEEFDEFGLPVVNTKPHDYDVDYAQLAAEIAAEKKAKEEAEKRAAYNKYNDYDEPVGQDTVLSEEDYIQEYELSEEQRLMALRFPERPNINSRQIIKDIRSIDVID